MRTFQALVVAAAIPFLLAGCSELGPSVVRAERNSYNDALHDTSAEQLLLNLARVHDYEIPSFSTFAEVDSQPNASINLMGGSSNIGALVPIGGLSSTMSASEMAIQKHVSVTGFELIQQLSRPITPQDIEHLEVSNAPKIPLLALTVNNIGPRFSSYYHVLTLLDLLDEFGSLQTESRTQNTLAFSFDTVGIVKHPDPTEDKAIFCAGQQNNIPSAVSKMVEDIHVSLSADGLKGPIILRSPEASVAAKSEIEAARVTGLPRTILTRSALGVLRRAEPDDGAIMFVDRATADSIRAENEAAPCFNGDFYFKPVKGKTAPQYWYDYYRFLFDSKIKDKDSFARSVGSQEIFVIVEESKDRPSDAFLSIRRGDEWFSINEQDTVSKKNFALVGLISTIEALPSAAPTPTTISAGK